MQVVTSKWFTNERLVAFGLAITFLVPISITIGVGFKTFGEMNRLQAGARDIALNQWVDAELANEAMDLSSQNMRINQEILLSCDRQDMRSLATQRDTNTAKISELIERLKTRVGSSGERKLLDAVVSARNKYLANYKRVTDIEAVLANPKEARLKSILVTAPLFVNYHAAWVNLARFQSDEVNRTLASSAAQHQFVRKRALVLLSLAILLSLATAILVIRVIVLGMRVSTRTEAEVRRMNAELESQVCRRTAALDESCKKLIAEIGERQRAEENLRSKTAFLEAQVNSTPDAVLVVDSRGQVILRNKRFIEFFKIPATLVDQRDDRLILQYAISLISHPEQFLEKVQYLYSHPEETSRDEIEFKDGMVLDRYSSPVIGSGGENYGRIWTFRDLTERKRNEDTLRQLSSAVEQSPVLIVITDPQGRITYVNPKFTECTGYSRQEVLGRNPKILKSGRTPEASYKALWQTITHGGEWRGQLLNRKKSGELYWESAVIRPIKDADGKISHYLAVKQDITQQNMLETHLRQAQKLEAIGQLAAGIAHEINTPAQFVGDNTNFLKHSWSEIVPLLEATDGVRSALRNNSVAKSTIETFEHCCEAADLDYLRSEIPKAIDQSLDGIQRITKIVRAMKEFSHPGSEEKQAVDLNKAIQTTITVARNEWKYVSEVETCFAPDLPLVSCHAAEFNQVILNLLVNSAHAIAEMTGGESQRKGRITIRTRREGDFVEIAISDTGKGIPESVRSRIFEPFFTTKAVGKGTGQGLALAHNTIVKRHGGKIWFESECNQGTTFFIHLPLTPDATEEEC